MSYVLDAVIVIIAVISVLLGIHRGFIKSLFKSFGFIAAIILAVIFTSFVSPSIEEKLVYDKVYDIVDEAIDKDITSVNINDVIDNISEDTSGIKDILLKFGINTDKTLNSLRVGADEEQESLREKIVLSLTDTISSIAAKAITFLALFILFYLVLLVVFLISHGIVRNGPLKYADKTFGGIYGTLMGYIKICIAVLLIANVIPALLSLAGSSQWLSDAVDKTFILKFFLQHNIIAEIIS